MPNDAAVRPPEGGATSAPVDCRAAATAEAIGRYNAGAAFAAVIPARGDAATGAARGGGVAL